MEENPNVLKLCIESALQRYGRHHGDGQHRELVVESCVG